MLYDSCLCNQSVLLCWIHIVLALFFVVVCYCVDTENVSSAILKCIFGAIVCHLLQCYIDLNAQCVVYSSFFLQMLFNKSWKLRTQNVFNCNIQPGLCELEKNVCELCLITLHSTLYCMIAVLMCHMASLHIISQSHPEAGEIKHDDPVYSTPWFWWIWSPSVRKCRSLSKGSLHFVLSLMRPIHLLLDMQDFLDSQDLSSDVRDETFKELMFPAAALSVDVAFFCLFVFVFHSCFCAVGYWKNMNKYNWFCNMTPVSLSLLLTW